MYDVCNELSIVWKIATKPIPSEASGIPIPALKLRLFLFLQIYIIWNNSRKAWIFLWILQNLNNYSKTSASEKIWHINIHNTHIFPVVWCFPSIKSLSFGVLKHTGKTQFFLMNFPWYGKMRQRTNKNHTGRRFSNFLQGSGDTLPKKFYVQKSKNEHAISSTKFVNCRFKPKNKIKVKNVLTLSRTALRKKAMQFPDFMENFFS